MKLEQAANLFKSDVDKWVQYYLASQKEQGIDGWPEDMDEADWFEQFLFFCSSGKDDKGE